MPFAPAISSELIPQIPEELRIGNKEPWKYHPPKVMLPSLPGGPNPEEQRNITSLESVIGVVVKE